MCVCQQTHIRTHTHLLQIPERSPRRQAMRIRTQRQARLSTTPWTVPVVAACQHGWHNERAHCERRHNLPNCPWTATANRCWTAAASTTAAATAGTPTTSATAATTTAIATTATTTAATTAATPTTTTTTPTATTATASH